MTVADIVEGLGTPRATATYHLKGLVDADLLVVQTGSRAHVYRPQGRGADPAQPLQGPDQVEIVFQRPGSVAVPPGAQVSARAPDERPRRDPGRDAKGSIKEAASKPPG